MERRVSPAPQELALYDRSSRAPYGRQATSKPYLEPYYPRRPSPQDDSFRLQSALYRRMSRSPPTRQNNLYADRRSAQTPASPYKSMSRTPPNALSLYRSPAPQPNSMSLYNPRRQQYPY